jgi:hypothetical protein
VIESHGDEEQRHITRFLSSNSVDAFNVRTPSEEVYLRLQTITDLIDSLSTDMYSDHKKVLTKMREDHLEKARREVVKKLGHLATEVDIKAKAQELDPPRPSFSELDWSSVMEHASSPEMTASLREVSKLLGRTTHRVARVAQAIMAHVGLHFTASGLTSRHVDNVQQPNLQGVRQILQWFRDYFTNSQL